MNFISLILHYLFDVFLNLFGVFFSTNLQYLIKIVFVLNIISINYFIFFYF